MSVNETELTTWISLAATTADKELLANLARHDGNTSQSAVVRRLIRQEAQRRGLVLPEVNGPAAANATAEV